MLNENFRCRIRPNAVANEVEETRNADLVHDLVRAVVATIKNMISQVPSLLFFVNVMLVGERLEGEMTFVHEKGWGLIGEDVYWHISNVTSKLRQVSSQYLCSAHN